MGTRQGRLPEPSDRRPVCAMIHRHHIMDRPTRQEPWLGHLQWEDRDGWGIGQSTNYFLLLCVSRPAPLGKGCRGLAQPSQGREMSEVSKRGRRRRIICRR